MADKVRNQGDREQVEQRSMGAVVTQFVSDAQHGAGWATGAAPVAGVAKTVDKVLPGGKDQKPKE
jgi:hypothetical protein